MKKGQNSKAVLFLAGDGSDRAIAACVRSLSSRHIPFHICISNKPISTPWKFSRYREHVLDNCYYSPTTPDEFKRSLASAIPANTDFILFPTSDQTIKPLLNDPEWLDRNGIKIPLPEKSVRQQVSNKSTFMELAEEYGLATPHEINPPPTQTDIPFVAKPKKNLSKDGEEKRPYLILNNSHFKNFFSAEYSDQYFYQDFISGESVYYCALYNEGSRVCDFSQMTLCQQPNGGSVIKAAPTRISDSVKKKFSQLMADLEWTGPVMVEFRRSQGKYYTIEANPRFWGPLQLAVDNGIDLPLALYHTATGELENYDSSLYQYGPNNRGYIRYNGYLNAWWMKHIFDGELERTHPCPDLSYYDVWSRCDTAPIFVFELLRSVFYPVTTTINSPVKVKSFIDDRFGQYLPI